MILLKLLEPALSVLDKVIDNKSEAERVKFLLMQEMLKKESEISRAAADVVATEAKGESWLQRNWRPSLMFLFGFIILNNYIIVPYATAFGLSVPHVNVPPDMWAMIQIGLGGYVVGRSGEKIAKVIAPAISGRKRSVDAILDENRP